MKKKILFVDDETRVLEGLGRMLRNMRSEWEMEFVASGPEALEALQRDSFHVLVTDMRMPGMDGYRLLEQAKELHPQVVRIILSGDSDKELILNSVGLAHQYLSKPCDPEILKFTIARVCAQRELLEDGALIDLMSGIDSLPSMPSLYTEIVEELGSPRSSVRRVGEIISKDIGMSSKLLQLVNSSFFGFPAHVSSIFRAVQLLGLETIKALILTIKVFSRFDLRSQPPYSSQQLWEHSIATGVLARSLATQEDLEQSKIDEAFTAGLLHDLGKLILLEKLPLKCSEIGKIVRSSQCPLWEAERQVLGTDHAKMGGYLLGIWGISESIIDAVAFHHDPESGSKKAFSTLTAVYLANSFEDENAAGPTFRR